MKFGLLSTNNNWILIYEHASRLGFCFGGVNAVFGFVLEVPMEYCALVYENASRFGICFMEMPVEYLEENSDPK